MQPSGVGHACVAWFPDHAEMGAMLASHQQWFTDLLEACVLALIVGHVLGGCSARRAWDFADAWHVKWNANSPYVTLERFHYHWLIGCAKRYLLLPFTKQT